MENKKPKDLEKEILGLEKEGKKEEKEKPLKNIEKENKNLKKRKVTKEEKKDLKPKKTKKETKKVTEETQDIGLMKENKNLKKRKVTEEEKKMDFLKRDDIRTMKKDLKKLRELKAEKETDDISLLGLKKREPEEQEETDNGKDKVSLAPKFSKQPKSSNKLLIRIVFVLVFLLITGGGYWFFQTQKDLYAPPVVEENEEEQEEEKPEIKIPESFATIKQEYTYQLGEKEKIIPASQNFNKEKISEGGLTRIILKNYEDKLIPLDDIEKIFSIELPDKVINKLNQENYNLFGTIREDKVEKDLVIEASASLSFPLSDLESQIKESLLEDIEEPEKSSIFKEFTNQEDKKFRCLVPSSDYSLTFCYTTINDYLVLSESFDSINQAVAGLNDASRKKIGQLFIVGFEGTSVTPELESFFRKYYPGGILLSSDNILSIHQTNSLIKELQKLSMETTGHPLIVGINQEGGSVNTIDFLEELTAQSDIENQDQAYSIALNRGKELKKMGINLNFSPLMDQVEDGDYIYNRSFQKNATTSGQLGQSMIIGYQGAEVHGCLKYFPGYVGTSSNPGQKLIIFEETPEIKQFEEAASANPKFIMTSNSIYKEIDPSLPFPFSEEGIKYLEHNIGRDPLIITDDLSQQALLNAYNVDEIVVNPIKAGVDLELISGYKFSVEEGLDSFLKAFNNNKITEEEVEESKSRIIKFKKEL